MAVYNKKDFENFLNKDKIKKQKIKKRIITSVSAVLAIVIIAGLVFLLMRDRGNYIKEDNYTEAIDFAIEKFANEKVGSFDAYPRLSYNYKTSPRPDKPVEDLKDNDIYIEYDKKDDSNKDNDINEDNSNQDEESNKNDNKNENTNQNPTDKPQENNPAPSPETTIYEYDHFFAIAGRGNYPGYGISGPTFIQDIRKEVCLAIKAYTTMPLAGGTDKDNYRLQYYDKQYDYVYFFLTGEVRKVDKLYLKQLDDTTGKNSYDVYNFWISLTEDKSSNIAKSLLNSDKPIYTIIVSDLKGKTIDNVTVSYIAGSYIETIKTSDNAILIFNDVPLGEAKLQVERKGYIGFPNAVAYKEYEEILVQNNVEYKGKHISNPLRVKLQQSSLGKCSFSYSSFFYNYNENKWDIEKDCIEGHYTVILKNTETEKTVEKILDFKGENIYLCEYFEEIKKGVYDIEIYPASDNLGALTINTVYINEYGLSDKGYLTEEDEYVFSFSTSEYVKVFFDIQDNTTYGLEGRKGIHNMYQMVETKATQEQKVEILLKDVESGQSYTQVLVNEDGRLVGNINVPQNKLYDVYVSTCFGNVLIQDDLRMRMGNYKFSASIEDKNLPQCMTNIYFVRNDTATMKIVNTANTKEFYAVTLTEGENNKYTLNYNAPISSGYYYLYVYNANEVQETYLLLISEKSNNYTVEFQ